MKSQKEKIYNCITKEKVYKFPKIKVILKGKPNDTLTYKNVIKRGDFFLLEDGSEIGIRSMQWYKIYKNDEDKIREFEDRTSYVAMGFVLFTAIAFLYIYMKGKLK